MPYYTLISRPVPEPGEAPEPWAIQFGDHLQAVVAAERLDMKATDRRNGWRTEYRIVRTASRRKALVDSVIASLTSTPRRKQAPGRYSPPSAAIGD